MELRKRLLCLPASLSPLVLFLSATVPLAAADPTLTEDSSCNCYLTNGNQSSYFTEHRFFDFRRLSQYAGVPDVIDDAASSPGADPTSAYFTSAEWTSFWMLGSWNNSHGDKRTDATVLMVNSPNNLYIEPSSSSSSNPAAQNQESETHLTLRTQRLATFQTAAEMESASTSFRYLSLRMRARTVGAAGAVTAMFTYRDGPTLAEVQESDLEIRTADPLGLIHYTNQPAYDEGTDEVVPDATRNATMPDGKVWTEWATHRMDWTPGVTAWYVDDVEVARIAFQAPKDESNIILNAWSDGGGWTGNMTRGEAAYLQVQWLEVVYNSTEEGEGRAKNRKRDGGEASGCRAVCSVDQTPQLGKPVMLWNNGAGRVSGAAGVVGWMPIGVVLVMVLVSTGLLG
ncbi:glycoside hydrolase family 16 protein [Parathielavia appendiculata]|uniref:Glycoside hydrolase family 16 protein n=1 Tax=Parathielavia appendiculata TaxID=2587402 RepID=A0AAN6Z377_9PEZI|nr:glycoside hydrolase family 16 protein [Parathielavia appendiculata]